MGRATPTRSQGGSIAMEIALSLPLIFLLVFSVFESGNLFWSWLTVQKAAQSGTRFAVTGQGELDGTRLTKISDAMKPLLSTLKQGASTVAVRSWPGLNADGGGRSNNPGGPCDTIEVSVTYLYEPLTPMIGSVLPNPMPLTGSDRKVNEPWQPCS